MSNKNKNQSELNNGLNINNEPNKTKLNNSQDKKTNKHKNNQVDTSGAKSDNLNPSSHNLNPSPHKPNSLPYILDLVASDPELQQQAVINALEKIYRLHSLELEDTKLIKQALSHKGLVYSIEDAKQFLRIIIINAFFDIPSYISDGEVVAKVCKIDEETKKKLSPKLNT